MKYIKENRRMSKEEILELMHLKGWSKTQLAAALDLGENVVYRWIQAERGSRKPGGPASILMRMWLDQARSEVTKETANSA